MKDNKPTEKVVSQHHSIVFDVEIKSCKEDTQLLIPKKKVWKLHESVSKKNSVTEFENATQRLYAEVYLENLWETLKDDLLSAAGKSFG